MFKEISSIQNKEVKWLLQLQLKSRNRRKEQLFVVEGEREVLLASQANFSMLHLYFCSELINPENIVNLASEQQKACEIVEITREVYEKLAYRTSTEGILAVFKTKDLSLEELKFKNSEPLILIAEAPEKPGNIGALFRTADAANLDAVIIANPKTDLYNPNIIRSSVGTVFTNNISTGNTSEIIEFLKKKNIKIYCAALQASTAYHKVNFHGSCALVVGTEATGLSQEWLDNADENLIIPMSGKIDSMNVSVAAGILIFEARKQRNWSNKQSQ